MVTRTSLRITAMNYHYEITVLPRSGSLKISPRIFFVKEQFKENGQTTFSWKIEELQNFQYPPYCGDRLQKSFFRTREWIFSNHPELML